MRVLVTGVSGFAGRHLAAELAAAGHIVIGFDRSHPTQLAHVSTFITGDVRDSHGLLEAIRGAAPDACVHLAGIAFVPDGWHEPESVFAANTIGAVNLLEAFRAGHPQARLLLVTSAEIYGAVQADRPITENDAPMPQSLYAVSKLSADLMGLLYAKRYGMAVMTARPANHIGPGQSQRFVTSAFARQLVEIRAGRQEPVLRVGNLASERSFMDVRDTVRAYRLLIEEGRPGEAYNVASPERLTIGALLDILCEEIGLNPKRIVDDALYRPTDRSPRLDTRKIQTHVGWEPRIPLRQTLRDILSDWTQRISLDSQTTTPRT